jgi:hypothetical protein
MAQDEEQMNRRTSLTIEKTRRIGSMLDGDLKNLVSNRAQLIPLAEIFTVIFYGTQDLLGSIEYAGGY